MAPVLCRQLMRAVVGCWAGDAREPDGFHPYPLAHGQCGGRQAPRLPPVRDPDRGQVQGRQVGDTDSRSHSVLPGLRLAGLACAGTTWAWHRAVGRSRRARRSSPSSSPTWSSWRPCRPPSSRSMRHSRSVGHACSPVTCHMCGDLLPPAQGLGASLLGSYTPDRRPVAGLTTQVTNRRVNALENVTIPRIERILAYINRELDELEREDFTRLKKVS
jgi:hypothetical protein